jgi:hypothetical protein
MSMPSRRDIIRLIGAGAAAAFAHGVGAAEEKARFPRGAVIRTVRRSDPNLARVGAGVSRGTIPLNRR